MIDRRSRMARILTYLGLIPFIGSSVALFLALPGLNYSVILESYSAVIASFLSGILWSVALFFPDKSPKYLLVLSNVLALLAWLSLLIPMVKMTLFFQAMIFICLFFVDSQLHQRSLIPEWFYTLRLRATVGVTTILLLTALFL